MVFALEVISIRVSKELKDEMRNLDVDWAEYLRSSIKERVRREKIRQACTEIDKVREKTVGVKFDSANVIREARESL